MHKLIEILLKALHNSAETNPFNKPKISPSTLILELLNTSRRAQFLQFFLLFPHPA